LTGAGAIDHTGAVDSRAPTLRKIVKVVVT